LIAVEHPKLLCERRPVIDDHCMINPEKVEQRFIFKQRILGMLLQELLVINRDE
jgi:hypothetical protein